MDDRDNRAVPADDPDGRNAAARNDESPFPPNDLAGLILAAGEGSRAGGPKALAVSAGRTWIEIAVTLLRSAGLRRIVVVLGARHEEISPLASDAHPAARVVVNADWRAGRTGSLQLGWRSLRPVRGVLVHQVDFPEVRASTVRALGEAFLARLPRLHETDGERAGPAAALGVNDHSPPPDDSRGDAPAAASCIFLPVFAGRRGHPILLGGDLWTEVHALGPDEPLRAVVRRDPTRVIEVDVDDPGIHANRNLPSPEST